MKSSKKTANSRKSPAEWRRYGERELKKVVFQASNLPALRRLGPKPSASWTATLQLIGAPKMTELNRAYRGKNRPTDVLSFQPPEIFRRQGVLGELVICLPVLKRQARELAHRPEMELKILLVHGVLHLLGLDHERGPRDAARMARLEARLLEQLRGGKAGSGKAKGLIDRAR